MMLFLPSSIEKSSLSSSRPMYYSSSLHSLSIHTQVNQINFPNFQDGSNITWEVYMLHSIHQRTRKVISHFSYAFQNILEEKVRETFVYISQRFDNFFCLKLVFVPFSTLMKNMVVTFVLDCNALTFCCWLNQRGGYSLICLNCPLFAHSWKNKGSGAREEKQTKERKTY